MNASEWLASRAVALQNTGKARAPVAAGLVGAPMSRLSLSGSAAWASPAAVRRALSRFHTYDGMHSLELEELNLLDFGDVAGDQAETDPATARMRLEELVAKEMAQCELITILGGDNSITRHGFSALLRTHPDLGLITFDAHHDTRPLASGPTNGTPVRELILGGLQGNRVAQIGINPLGNGGDYARWTKEQGVHLFYSPEIHHKGVGATLFDALTRLRKAGAHTFYVDFDMDVLDRAFAPGCPGSLPGGMHPAQLAHAAFQLGRDPNVVAADFTEVDALADVNEITVRATAYTLLNLYFGRLSGRKGA